MAQVYILLLPVHKSRGYSNIRRNADPRRRGVGALKRDRGARKETMLIIEAVAALQNMIAGENRVGDSGISTPPPTSPEAQRGVVSGLAAP